MKCNLPKSKPLSVRDQQKITDKLTMVRCCKCGGEIETMSVMYTLSNFDPNRYSNRICPQCAEMKLGSGV